MIRDTDTLCSLCRFAIGVAAVKGRVLLLCSLKDTLCSLWQCAADYRNVQMTDEVIFIDLIKDQYFI